MSKAINQCFQHWKTIEQSVRCHTFKFKDRNLSHDDNIVVQDVVVLLMLIWCECFTPSSYSNTIPRWMPRWCKTIESYSWDRIARFFKSADDLVLSFFNDDTISSSVTCYDDFKRHLRKEFEFAGDIISPAREAIDAFLSYHSEASAFLLHQAFAFTGRTSLKDVPELADAMVQKFEDNCDRVAAFNHDFSMDDERNIIKSWFLNEPDYNEFRPRHGNGAVFEKDRKSITEKYFCGGPDQLLDYVIRSRSLPIVWPFSEEKLTRIARVELVPKSSTSFRTITMEPACLMYAQQGVRRLLVSYIDRHPQLSRHINLSDQGKSRSLCCFSSVDGEYATIDLSMASDSISMTLFRAWFHDTWLYPLAIGSRSTTVQLPDGHQRLLPFFAGMGCAITFPLQCVIYSAICEATIAEVGRRPGEKPFRVYGDDIIIHRRYVSVLMRRLTEYGFIVNSDKSYYAKSTFGIFRESCGVEYLNGNDIKPVRIPRKFRGFRPDSYLSTPELYGNIISLANEFLNNHLHLAYLWLVHSLNELPICLRPLFGDSDSDLHTLYANTNHNIQIMWSDDYFSAVAIHGLVQPVHRTKHIEYEEEVRYFETLRLMMYRTEKDISEPITASRPKPLALEPTETILSSR